MNTIPLPKSAPDRVMPAGHPRPGNRVRLTVSDLGYSLSANPGGGSFLHPFRASLAGTSLRVRKGFVDFVEPKIGKVPMSQTTLPLQPGIANANGESWACIELTPDGDGNVIPDKLQIVHVKDPAFFTPTVARCPIAQIVWRGRTPAALFQILYFNVRYFRLQETANFTRHFFL